jgi:hypothetical protein
MENHNFQWENQLFLWPFSSSQIVKLTECTSQEIPHLLLVEPLIWTILDPNILPPVARAIESTTPSMTSSIRRCAKRATSSRSSTSSWIGGELPTDRKWVIALVVSME